MCKAPRPPKPKEPDKPEWLHNPYLDAAVGQASAVNQLRRGRASLRIPMASNLAISNVTPATTPPAGVHTLPPAGSPEFRRTVLGGVRTLMHRRIQDR